MKNLSIQWKSLKVRKDREAPRVKNITKALPIIKWTEDFADYINCIIGVRMIPLAYMIRETVEVPPAAPFLMAGQPHLKKNGLVEGEIVARASYTHALYLYENAKVYYLLEEATRTNSYSASIKPFQRIKDGQATWLDLKIQYSGKDK